jgi:hypothetical protein
MYCIKREKENAKYMNTRPSAASSKVFPAAPLSTLNQTPGEDTRATTPDPCGQDNY